ncbi:MAG TPA: hypothetical protein VLF67_04005, partial [Candidatus Saccharimonas sp.]|nr:hypothetical protein [Candidatus Saccharimonas sp.]
MANERFMDITPPTSSQPLPGAQVLPDQPPTWPGLATVPTPPPSLPPRRGLSLKTIVLIAGAVVVAGGTVAAILLRANRPTSTQAGDFKSVQLSLADLASNPGATGLIGASLQVNGRLNLSDSVVFNPSTQPTSPVAGQLYYDQTANQLAFYNGQGYLNLGATTNNTTNVTNVLTGGGAGVKLQATTPGTPQTGHLAITGTAIVGTLSTNIIDGGTAKPLFLNPVSVSTAPTPAGIPVHIGLDVPGATTEASPGWQDGMNAQKVTMGADGGKLQSMSVMYVGG